ncbi:hypothetical protein OSTOST_13255 [Ostertagia ostertagi]
MAPVHDFKRPNFAQTPVAHARTPLIKFIGARLPRPDFSRVVSGPIPSPPVPPTPAAASASVGAAAQTAHGAVITEDELPPQFRRPLIDQEECDAINVSDPIANSTFVERPLEHALCLSSTSLSLTTGNALAERMACRTATATKRTHPMLNATGVGFTYSIFSLYIDPPSMSDKNVLQRSGSTKERDLLSLVHSVVEACTSKGVEEQRKFAESLSRAWTPSADTSATFTYYVSKKQSSDGDHLRTLLRAVEVHFIYFLLLKNFSLKFKMCSDDFCLVLLCKLIQELINTGSIKARQRRHRKLIKADATSSLIRTLRICCPSVDTDIFIEVQGTTSVSSAGSISRSSLLRQ